MVPWLKYAIVGTTIAHSNLLLLDVRGQIERGACHTKGVEDVAFPDNGGSASRDNGSEGGSDAYM